MSERKYKKGKPIRSMYDFEKSECAFFIITFGGKEKTRHVKVLQSFTVRTLLLYIHNGWVYEAERIANE